MPGRGLIYDLMYSQMEGIFAQEQAQMVEMANRWYEIEKTLRLQFLSLAEEVERMRADNITVTPAKLSQMQYYRDLLIGAQGELQRYAEWAEGVISTNQGNLLELGIANALEVLRYAGIGMELPRFPELARGAFENIIGMARDGSPLRKLLFGAYGDAVDGLTNALIQSVAQGLNPAVTARAMANGFGVGLNRAMTIARTEQLRAYRTAQVQQWDQSGLVEYYVRQAALSLRTCPACLALDGKIYKTSELMHVHPNDRCTMVPKLRGVPLQSGQSGEDWFRSLDESAQIGIMGAGKYAAWRDGQFEFKQLAHAHADPKWGPSLAVVPLRKLASAEWLKAYRNK